MARHDQDDMTRHTAVFPTIYANGTNPSGTSQNGTSRHGTTSKASSNGSSCKLVASSGIGALASLNDAAISQNSINGFAVGRPSMNDRLMRASEVAVDSRPPSGATWQSSWGSTRAGTRESSRTREISSLSSRAGIESKTGSKAFLPHTDVWNDSPASSQPPLRSVRTSPVRRDSNFSVQDPSSNSSTPQNVFGSRTAYQRPTNGPSHHQDQQHMNGSTNAFGHQTRLSDENPQFRGLANAWSSPPPALRSLTNGNNGRTSFFAPSRNGSRDFGQPPLRYGSDYHGTFGQPSTLLRSRSDFPTLSALSNGTGKSPLERDDLQQSDLTGTFAQMSIPDSQDGSNHSRSHSSAISPPGLFSQFSQNLTNGHDEKGSTNGVAPFQTDALNVFPNPVQQQQPSDSRFAQPGGYLPVLNDLHQNSNSHTGPTYQNRHDPATIAALTLQLQQQQFQLQHQQQMMLSQHARYRNLYAPHQQSRMNPQQQYPMMPMQPGMLSPAVMQPQTMLASAYPYGSNQTMEATRISSSKLAEFKELHDKNKQPAIRWELKDIFGYVVEFSGDQLASRFIQSRLETANSDEKEKLVQEILPEVFQLSEDVFGNYVIQKLFHHCDQAQKRALANKMKTRMFSLSVDQYACRVVQDVLTRILSDQQHELVQELVPDLERLAKNVNANHVIQVSIQTLDSRWHQTVLTAFHGKIFALSKDQYGCRVIQRLLENCVEPEKRRIFEELHPNTVALVTNNYGNYVAQNMMRYGTPEDRSKIIDLIKTYLLLFAKNKFASNVVEKCLTFGSVEERRDLMEVLLQNPDHICQLIQDSFGNYVVQQFILLLEGDDYQTFVAAMRPQMAKAKANSSGKQIAAVEKLMQHKSASNGTIAMPTQKSATNSTNNTHSVDALPGHDPLPNFRVVG